MLRLLEVERLLVVDRVELEQLTYENWSSSVDLDVCERLVDDREVEILAELSDVQLRLDPEQLLLEMEVLSPNVDGLDDKDVTESDGSAKTIGEPPWPLR